MTELLEVYGPSITTATPAEWPRHRKVLATPFNETAMQFVWDESFQQAIQMLSTWTDQTVTAGSIRNVAKDTRTLSLNVLAAVGFRRSFPFQPAGGPNRTTDVAASYRDALSTVLDNVILLMLVPYRYLQLPIFPRSLQRIGRAGAEYKQHMERMLKEELLTFERHSSSTRGLMTSFAKALNTHEGQKSGAAKAQGLSKEEILGNMFVINFAGHDTTANTLAFAMLLLATKPHVQEWLAGEVSKVATDGDEWNYASIFPRLIRCRAVLARLYFHLMVARH
jgi:cytochrome P450